MENNNDYYKKIDNTFPILLRTIVPAIFIDDNFTEDSELRKNIKKSFSEYLQFLGELSNPNGLPLEIQNTMVTFSDFSSLNKKLCFSIEGFYRSLAYSLNVPLDKNMSFDEIAYTLQNKIKEFEKIRNIETLKSEFPYFYSEMYYPLIKDLIPLKYEIDKRYSNMNKKEKQDFRKKFSFSFDQVQYLDNVPRLIFDYSQIFNTLLRNRKKIEAYLLKTSININLNSEGEFKKFDLMIAVIMFFNYIYGEQDDKQLLYIKDYFERNNNQSDDSIRVVIRNVFSKKSKNWPVSTDFIEQSNFTPKRLYQEFQKIISAKKYLNMVFLNDNFSNMNRNQIVEYVDSLLNDLKNNFKKISHEDVQKKLKQIMENSDKTEVSKQKLESLIRKIDFLLNHRPISIIKGEETFNNYFGYIYSNGYVVLDYISSDVERSYGHALYVIHISDLKKYSKLSLSELRKNHSDKIISIVHSSKWEDKLESILSSNIDSTTLTVSSEMDQIDMATTLAELEYLKNNLAVVNEEVEKKLKEKEVKIKKIKQYDEEIKQTPVEENLSDEDKEELLEAEIDLLANSGNSSDFVSLHEKALEKKYKVKRNPDVSLKTKLRTLDENGAFHCDFCNSPSFALDLYDAHHIIPISKGGIDNVYNTTCLCPSCHRKFHSKIPPTFAERGLLLQRVRERILESTPEYLPNFDALFNPNYHNDVGLSESDLLEKYKQEEDYYSTHKEEEDQKFLVDWNTHHK